MQGRISGFFMTIFMVLPLAAIPLMSIFGIPQFGSMASTLDQTGFFPEDPIGDSTAPAYDVNLDAAPAFSDDSDVQTAFNDESGQPFPTEFQSSSTSDSTEQTDDNDYSANGMTSTAVSWETAVEQLQQYGITDYRIQRGMTPGSSQIACYSQVPGQSTVIRFEAEGADPLQALNQVLQQVKLWRHR